MFRSAAQLGVRIALGLSAGFVGYYVEFMAGFWLVGPWFFSALAKHPGLAIFTRSEGADEVSVDPWGVRVGTAFVVAVVVAGLFARTRTNRALMWGAILVGFIGADLYWSRGYLMRGAAGLWSADLYVFAAATGAMLRLTSPRRAPRDSV